eukprot:SAG22_NODE_823_length_6993_cov_6.116913_1_plen_87_part_10
MLAKLSDLQNLYSCNRTILCASGTQSGTVLGQLVLPANLHIPTEYMLVGSSSAHQLSNEALVAIMTAPGWIHMNLLDPYVSPRFCQR